jgi:arylsulfatase A-like enzyme
MNVIVILCDTLRRDHCGPYHHGRPLNECWSAEAPDWVVPTPNMDRLGARGTVFEHAYCGSHPCMPARRDLYTGRYDFLERGWAPLEEDDLDLPRQVSGPPNRSLRRVVDEGYRVSYLVTDHFHLWEQGSGNYHMGYSGFEFVRGAESDAWHTAPLDDFPCPPGDRLAKNERHWRNVHHIRRSEEDWFCAQVFRQASDWLERNHTYDDFYLHLDCFDPHEPWDPPAELVEQFDPQAYAIEGWKAAAPYAKWRGAMTEQQFKSARARYAAKVVLVDRWLGRLLDTMDRLDLWKDTLVVFTTDHGTYNGDHGRMGKMQTHVHDASAHIPFIVAHPTLAHGERREQLVQLVDIYPTGLAAVGRPIPASRHGVNLLPLLEDRTAPTREYAISGVFGKSVSITDGRWVLHQSPVPENRPLHWHSPYLAKFLPYDLGPYRDGYRDARTPSWPEPTWLSDTSADPNELENLATTRPDILRAMQQALSAKLVEVGAPPEQRERLGLP